jgi:hypothetical protein
LPERYLDWITERDSYDENAFFRQSIEKHHGMFRFFRMNHKLCSAKQEEKSAGSAAVTPAFPHDDFGRKSEIFNILIKVDDQAAQGTCRH